MDKLSSGAAAKLLGVTPTSLLMLVKQGIVHIKLGKNGSSYYFRSEIDEIKSRRGLTVAQEASQIESEIRQATVLLARRMRRTLTIFGGLLGGYILLVAVITVLFIVNPIQTADWIGMTRRVELALTSQGEDGQVLGETTDVTQKRSLIQGFLVPVGKSSLTIVKNISPSSYAEVAKVAILDPSDVFGLDTNGGITPERPITLPDSSLLQVGSSGLISNLNSEYLQGLKPGTSLGDIAIVSPTVPVAIANESGITIETLEPLSGGGLIPTGGKISLNCPNCLVSLSNIANSALANSSLTVSAGSGLSGGGSVSLGGTIALLAEGLTPTNFSTADISQWSNDAGYLTSEADTLQSVFNRGNTIPTTTGIVANTIDEATLKIGNIESTATQNFATLNITNGGTGFLDLELIRGFINFQDMNTLYDDFTSKSLDTADRWTSVSTGTGSTCTIMAGGVGGLLRMDSGPGANRGCELSTQAIGSLDEGYYQRANNPIVETKLKIDVVTNARIVAGFTNTRVAVSGETNPSTHHAYISKRGSDTTWQCVTDDGGAIETTTNTGVTIVAGTYYRLRVELRNGTTPETICTVDNGTTVTRTVVSSTQPGSTSSMDVYIKLNQTDTVAKNMDVDYIRAWQDDPPVFSLTSQGDVLMMPETNETTDIVEEEVVVETQAQEEPGEPDSDPLTISTIKEMIISQIGDWKEFFGNIIFQGDVSFLGHLRFSRDTVGRVLIPTGERAVRVSFERAYSQTPVVIANINFLGELSGEIPSYAVYQVDKGGFVIKLSGEAQADYVFSWIAIDSAGEVSNNNQIVIPSASPIGEEEIIQENKDSSVSAELEVSSATNSASDNTY